MHSHKTCKKESRNDGTTKSSKATSQLRPHRRSAGILLFCSVISRNRRRLLLLKHHRGDVHPLNPLNPPRRRTDRGKETQFGSEKKLLFFLLAFVARVTKEKVKPKKGEIFDFFFDFWLLFLTKKTKDPPPFFLPIIAKQQQKGWFGLFSFTKEEATEKQRRKRR
jgi:hypothetical protein